MKKSKLLVLAAFSALALTACGGNTNTGGKGELPSGGEAVDVKEEAGKEKIKERVNKVPDAYSKVEGITLNENASGSLSLNASATIADFGSVSANLGINDVVSTGELKLGKSVVNEQGAIIEGSLSASFGGNLSLSGSLNLVEQEPVSFSANASAKDAAVNAYLKDDKAYVDLSSSGLNDAVNSVSGFATKLLADLMQSPIGQALPMLLSGLQAPFNTIFNAETNEFNFGAAFDLLPSKKIAFQLPSAVPFPEIPAEEETTPIDQTTLEQVLEMAAQFGVEFKLYGDNAFGVQANITKETLKEILTTFANAESGFDVSMIDQFLNKFEVKAYAYFNDSLLLESAGVYCDIDVKYNYAKSEGSEEVVTVPGLGLEAEALNINAQVKGSYDLSFKYGQVQFNFPSDLDQYALVETSQPIDQGIEEE